MVERWLASGSTAEVLWACWGVRGASRGVLGKAALEHGVPHWLRGASEMQ